MRSDTALICVKISLGLIVTSMITCILFPELVDIGFPILILSVIWLVILIYILAEDEKNNDYIYRMEKREIERLTKESEEKIRKLEEELKKYE